MPTSQGLLDEYGRRLARLLGCNVGELLQLFGAYLTEISEKKDKRQLDALLGHHEETLDEQTLENLWSNTLEESHWTFVLDDVCHDFGEGLEGFSVPGWRWLRLKTDLCDDERLCCECSQGF